MLSHPGAPLEARIPIHGTQHLTGIRAAVIRPKGFPLSVDEKTTAVGVYLELKSARRIPDQGLALRIQISQGSVVFAANYSLMPDAAGSVPNSLDDVYAGQAASVKPDEWAGDRIHGNKIGPTRPGDKLGDIARKIWHQNSGDSLSQIELALFKANPLKFADKDPLKLKPFVMLRIPDSVSIYMASPGKAKALHNYLAGKGENPYAHKTAGIRPPHSPPILNYYLEQITGFVVRWWHWGLIGLVLCIGLLVVKRKIQGMVRGWRRWLRLRRVEREHERLKQERAAAKAALDQAPDSRSTLHRQRIEQLEIRLEKEPHSVWLQVMLAREHLHAGDQQVFLTMARQIKPRATPGQWYQIMTLATEAGIEPETLTGSGGEPGGVLNRPSDPRPTPEIDT